MGRLLNVVHLMFQHLPLLTRYTVHHVIVGNNAPPVATRVSVPLLIAFIRGEREWLKDLFVLSLESVLVIEIDICSSQVVLIHIRKTFLLSWGSIQSNRRIRDLKHFISRKAFQEPLD